MTTEINVETATEWLKNHYNDVPGIWYYFSLDDAAISLTENTLDLRDCDDESFTYDDFNRLDLMCIMADAKM